MLSDDGSEGISEPTIMFSISSERVNATIHIEQTIFAPTTTPRGMAIDDNNNIGNTLLTTAQISNDAFLILRDILPILIYIIYK
jgi:hypothetical protein